MDLDAADADSFAHRVARDWTQAPLSDADRALCAYAVKLTLHQHDMSPADLYRLRDHGFDDTAIHDATQVIAYFHDITRIADALCIDQEDFIRPFEQSREPLPGQP